jgi:Protein of unknown function (DUF1214)
MPELLKLSQMKSSILNDLVAPDRQPVSEKISTGTDKVKITASAEGQQGLFAEEWQLMSAKIAELGPWLMGQPDVLKDDPQVVLDGYRYLATLLYAGIYNHTLNADVDRPKFISNWDDLAGWTSNSRDGMYRCTNIDPNGTYRVVCKPQGGLPVTATFQLMNNFWKTPGGGKTLAVKNLYDLKAEKDGSYEVILSKHQAASGNFVHLVEGTEAIMFREYIASDELQKRFIMSIERIDQPQTVPAESDTKEQLAEKLNNAVDMVKHAARVYLDMTRMMRKTINGIAFVDDNAKYGGSLENKYYSGSWDLGPDEALVFELKPVNALYWSITATNFWNQALSATDIPGEINNYDAVTDPDGKIRILITHNDPGYINWISTGGLKVGNINTRFNFLKEEEKLTCKKIRLADLNTVMASDSIKVTPEAREKQLRKTRMGVLDRMNR